MDLSFSGFRAAHPPRVQIFVSDLSATGVVRNAIAIANQAAASGFQVRLLTCHADGVLRDEVEPAVEVIALLDARNRTGKRDTQLKRALIRYRQETRQWRPDIMLSAGNHGHLLSSFAWLGLPGIKVLRISNDLGHGRARLSWFKRIRRAIKFRFMAGLADRLILVSRSIEQHPMMAPHVKSGKALAIPNGVDVAEVRRMAAIPCPHPWLADPRVPAVLAVGRPAPQKNFGTLIRALAEARKERELRLVILGGGDRADVAGIARLASQLGVRQHVDFVASVPNPFSYMAAADVLALPSLWEGSSNVLLEAMACGTPVVAATSAGDARVVLDKGRFGLLVEPLDEEALASALLHQTGERPILPAKRARELDRGHALAAYMQLLNQLAGAPARNAIGDVHVKPPRRKLAVAR